MYLFPEHSHDLDELLPAKGGGVPRLLLLLLLWLWLLLLPLRSASSQLLLLDTCSCRCLAHLFLKQGLLLLSLQASPLQHLLGPG